MATQPLAKPPNSLSLEDRIRRGDNWKQFKREWTYYETAAKINKEEGAVRVAHLFNVISKEGQDIFDLKHLLFLKPIVTTSQRFCKSFKRDVLPPQMSYMRGTYLTSQPNNQVNC